MSQSIVPVDNPDKSKRTYKRVHATSGHTCCYCRRREHARMKLLLFALFVAVCLESIQATVATSPVPTHLRASSMPLAHPFKIICYANKSVSIHNDTSYKHDLFVAGSVSACPYHKQHFVIDNNTVTLNSSCMDKKEGAFLIEVQNRSLPTLATGNKTVMGGKNSVVYRVTCIPNTDGDPVSVSIMPPVSVQANASQLVLPSLKIGIFAASTVPVNDPTKPITSLILGSEAQLVIYNDRGNNRMSDMLIPSQCIAFPNPGKSGKPRLTLLKEDNNNNNKNNKKCAHEDKLLSSFNVTNTTDYDLAYATLYPFKFEGFTDQPVVLECTVYICPKDDKVDGVRTGYCDRKQNSCSQVSPTSDYTKKRRRRDVGVGESGVRRATLRATFSVQEPLMAGASRCSTGIWALVALMYIFK
ncbi:uncharacterized protein LOC124285237 isoform X4 [Haliotis rubra]|uniref:uncharacterized protein LOC124285237 isoform X4 n=1 Tax=Haliotis rubra TaxID=36100 RepID=UPI001EE54884|nr:uncharacterized protein LOC124285237 isoform X4 [Haliotis rubra]